MVAPGQRRAGRVEEHSGHGEARSDAQSAEEV